MSATWSENDDCTVDPRLLALHQQLREVLLHGGLSSGPDSGPSPSPYLWRPQELDVGDSATPTREVLLDGPRLDFAAVDIPQSRIILYLQNWVTESAPILDKLDTNHQFQIQVPIIARSSPSVLYAMLTFSARQMEMRGAVEVNSCHDSPALYQESIRLLLPALQAKDSNVLVATCILAAFELMSWNPTDWRRHLEGCAALLGSLGVNGFSGGIAQAMFWCYARMEVCNAIVSDGTETAVLHASKWVPSISSIQSVGTSAGGSEFIQALLFHYGHDWHPDMYANWATYLCARVCDLRYRRTQHTQLGQSDKRGARSFLEQWYELWRELQRWVEDRPSAMLAMPNILSDQRQTHSSFPTILFSHNSAISGNQLYHTACMLMLKMRPPDFDSTAGIAGPEMSSVWHARRICGISCTNPHKGSRIEAIQPLYIAGQLFTHVSERMEIARLLRIIGHDAGWGAWSRLQDLESEWGYNYKKSSVQSQIPSREADQSRFGGSSVPM